MLPGGRILFSVSPEKPEQAGSYAISLANPKERVRVLAGNTAAVYAAGHLLWRREATLMAQRFDPDRLQLSGEPRIIADRVGTTGATAGAVVAAASSALLVLGRMGGEQLAWVDREGNPSGSGKSTLGEPGSYSSYRVSPDGRRVVVSRRSPSGTDLWMVDAERDAWSRFTFLPGTAWIPVWSPDGKQVMFRAGTHTTLYRKEASGAGTEQRITESVNRQWPGDWSRDGRLVLYHESTPETQVDLWVLPVTPDGQPSGKARPYLRSRFMEEGGRFSPEPSPRWVAYMSDESGSNETYLQAVPEPRAKFQISTGGGEQPEWSPDGRELFYVPADGKLMAASLQLGADSVTPSTPRELFALPGAGTNQAFKVGRDGNRFLVRKPAGGASPLEVIVNWTALLKKGTGGE